MKMDKYFYPLYILYAIRNLNKRSIHDLIGDIPNNTLAGIFGMSIICLVHYGFIKVFDENKELTKMIKQYALSSYDFSNGYELCDRFRGDEKVITFEIGEAFNRFQSHLKFSLTEHIENERRMHEKEVEDKEYLKVKPIFSLGTNRLLSPHVFVIMPFQEQLMQIYYDHILTVCRANKLQSYKADDIFAPNAIIDDIWQCIKNAKLIICDCTYKNPNVFYELGIAHAIGKKVICITQNESDIPFDIKHIRYIKYEFTPRGMIEFEKILDKYIKEEFKKE